MPAKWFDLRPYDAKIERIHQGGGQHALRLELDPARAASVDQEDRLEAGWALEDAGGSGRRAVLFSDRVIHNGSQVQAALRTFFSDDEIKSSTVGQDRLRQDERVDGVGQRAVIDDWRLAEATAPLAPDDAHRVTEGVHRAVEVLRARTSREAGVPLGRQGHRVFDHLVDVQLGHSSPPAPEGPVRARTGSRAVGPAPGGDRTGDDEPSPPALDPHVVAEMGASLAAVKALREAIDQPLGARGRQLEALGRALSEGDRAGAAAVEERLRDDPELGRGAAAVRLVLGIGAAGQWSGRGRPRERVVHDALKQGLLDGRAMTDIAADLSERVTLESLKGSFPFMVRHDRSIPSRVVADHLVSSRRAVEFVADQLGLPPDGLMPDQRSVPWRFASGRVTFDGGANAAVHVAVAQGMDGAPANVQVDEVTGELDRGVIAATSSVARPGAFVHELGHTIDFGNQVTDEERMGVLQRTGIYAIAMDRIARTHPEGGPEAAYLGDPAEIWARSMEAMVINASQRAGDARLERAGGAMSIRPHVDHAPLGDHAMTRRFAELVREIVVARRDKDHAARADARATAEAVHEQDASPRPRR